MADESKLGNSPFGEATMAALALALFIIVVVDTVAPPSSDIRPLILFVDWSILALFWIDFLVRLGRSKDRTAFFSEGWTWLDILILVLPFVTLANLGNPELEVLLQSPIFRLIRILRAGTAGLRALQRFHFHRTLLKNRYYDGVAAILLLYSLAVTIYYIEERSSGRDLDFAGAAWWGIVVMFTGGPETWPTTPVGRILQSLLTIGGVIFIAMTTANVIHFALEKEWDQERERDEHADEVRHELLREVRQLRKLAKNLKNLETRLASIESKLPLSLLGRPPAP